MGKPLKASKMWQAAAGRGAQAFGGDPHWEPCSDGVEKQEKALLTGNISRNQTADQCHWEKGISREGQWKAGGHFHHLSQQDNPPFLLPSSLGEVSWQDSRYLRWTPDLQSHRFRSGRCSRPLLRVCPPPSLAASQVTSPGRQREVRKRLMKSYFQKNNYLRDFNQTNECCDHSFF